jgi:uracil-DNA glycosylase
VEDLLKSVACDWRPLLAEQERALERVSGLLSSSPCSEILPGRSSIFRAFETPLADIRVVIVGQDPYPTPGHATGLAFSVGPQVRPLPRTLRNILREYSDDLNVPTPNSGDLTPWSKRGVLLLNRTLTVESGRSGSHRGKGWEEFTDAVVAAIVNRLVPVVGILWGRQASELGHHFAPSLLIESAHPSPLSASRGFFGSRPFTRANEMLESRGQAGIDWRIDSGTWTHR